jgi:hypothetical protein
MLAALVLVAGLLATACGGSDSVTADSGGPADVRSDAPPPADAGDDVDTGRPVAPDAGGRDVVPGAFGDPCESNADCASGWCIESEQGRVCTATCDSGCPPDWFCVPVLNTVPDVVFVCKPTKRALCEPCAADEQCPDGYCLGMGEGVSFCTGPCSHDGACPDGYTCRTVTSEEDATLASDQCLPLSGVCDCDEERAGTSRPCLSLNELGTCWGVATCDPAAGWTGCTARVPAAELCDAIDQDCDGIADDGAVPPVEPCAVTNAHGTCAGAWVCRGADGWRCTAATPAAESCNYDDDDCDGTVDEDFRDGPAGAYVAQEHCGACGIDCATLQPGTDLVCDPQRDPPACVVATCPPGTYRAGPFACVPLPASPVCEPCLSDGTCRVPGDRCLTVEGAVVCGQGCGPDSPWGTGCPAGAACVEQPDGGRQCLPASGSCSCWKPTHAGQQRGCLRENAAGRCYGVEACDPAAGWGACSAAEPLAEICDGLDSDCDGAVDEDVTPPATPCAVQNAAGRCVGTWACRAPDQGGAVTWVCDAATPAGETCNFRDDDCDGTTDEGFRDATGAYTTDDHCGVCGYSCRTALPNATEVRCVVDQGLPYCAVLACEPGYEVAPGGDYCLPFVGTDDCTPCVDDVQCGRLPGVCGALEGAGFCLRSCGDGAECPLGYACENLDGSGDAGARVCVPESGSCTCWRADHEGVTRACVRENAAGVCTGLQTCAVDLGGAAGGAAGGWSPCTAAEPAAESCNGRDDDCDGEVDEGVHPPAAPCAITNAAGTCEGTWRCAPGGAPGGGTGWLCDAPVPAAEVCNYGDDDCDGQTDEDFRTGDAYDGVANCGVCGYSCLTAIPFVAEAVCDTSAGSPACRVVTCQAGYGQPEGFDICVPFGAVNDCSPCATDDQCAGLPGTCVVLDGGRWCARDCAAPADCPPGYACDAGRCLPVSGSCTCGVRQVGLERPCFTANTAGVCLGVEVCRGAAGWTACTAGEAAVEICNGADDDCDGATDEAGAQGCTVYARDDDRDGYGRDLDLRCLCAPAAPYDAEAGGDCDDGDPLVSPGSAEVCDGRDRDCDGTIDGEGAAGCVSYARDADGDGFGVTGVRRCLCAPAFPWTAVADGDCDDRDPLVSPAADELCAAPGGDARDEDCDGMTDEPGAVGCVRRYPDADGDGWGAAGAGVCTCRPDLALPVERGGDCDDADEGVHPGVPEACAGDGAGRDDDCDGLTDEEGAAGCVPYFRDEDQDGFGAPFTGRCLCAPAAPWTALVGGDCDDGDPTWVPGAAEGCTVNADCCRPDDVCRYGQCVPAPAFCDTDDDCWNDAWCDVGECLPYGVGPRGEANPGCVRPTVPGLFQPSLQCAWSGPPAGDPYPNHRNVLSTTMVADFDFDRDPTTVRPSIVFTSYNYTDGGDQAADGAGASASYYGILRIIDGATCAQLYNITTRRVVGADPPALGDLDGDGRPEIVAHGVGGGLLAFRWNPTTNVWDLLWESHLANGTVHRPYAGVNRWNGPSITDVDGDGRPEAVMATYVYDRNGVLQCSNLGNRHYSQGHMPVLADVDLDGEIELVMGEGIYRYATSAGVHTWVRESYNAAATDGLVAIGDFGDFPVAGLPANIPEIVVISSGNARVQDLAGRTIFGPYPLPFFPPATDRGTGGPPTIGDFDNDGRPEFALAGRGAFTIFDLDCVPPQLPQGCTQNGILWTLPSQDYSSSVTGSSVFDFEGDGFAEAIYSDECFTRVYRGLDGEVLFSQWRSSCTWYENPIIADVDGDGYTEIVMGSNTNCSVAGNCPALDPYFRGLRCQGPAECANGQCVAGFCRCTADAQCGGTDFVCADPLPNTPAGGRVCRARHPRTGWGGVRVYRDALDNWVNSRMVWNQHAYFVTNVLDDGTIPPDGEWATNWTTPGLNNFRQNIQGSLEPTRVPDLTVDLLPPGNCDAHGALVLQALVCNRGAAPTAGPVTVAFYDGDPTLGRFIGLPSTQTAPAPGTCERVTVPWTVTPPTAPHDVYVVADHAATFRECWEGNNVALAEDVSCVNLP